MEIGVVAMALRTTPIVLPLYEPRAASPRSRTATIAIYAALIGLGTLYGLMVATLPNELITIPVIPIVIMALVCLWLLPDINSYNDRSIHKAFFIFISLFIVWPSYLALAIPGVPWISFTRIALFWMMILFMWAVSTSSQLRAQIIEVSKTSKPAFWFLMLFIFAQVIAIPFANDVPATIQRVVGNMFLWTAIFFLGCHIFLKPGTTKKFLVSLMWLAAFTALLSLWENQIEYIPYAPYVPKILRSDEEYLARIFSPQARAADGFYRAHSVFTVSLVFAQLLAFCMPFIIHFGVTTRNTFVRFLCFIGYVLFSAGIWVSHSRLGIVGWFESHFLYLILWSVRRLKLRKSDMIAPALTYGFPGIFLAFVVLAASWRRLRVAILGDGSSSASDASRIAQRDRSIPLILKHPLGHGAGQGADALNFRNGNNVLTVDSYVLTLLLDYGFLGFIGYFGFFVSAALNGIKTYLMTDDEEIALAGPLAIAILNSLVINIVLSSEQMQPLLFLFAAAIFALSFRRKAAIIASLKGDEFNMVKFVQARD